MQRLRCQGCGRKWSIFASGAICGAIVTVGVVFLVVSYLLAMLG